MAMMAAPPQESPAPTRAARLLKEQEERNCSRPDTDASKCGIVETDRAKLLIPARSQPEDREVKKNRERSGRLHHETAEAIPDVIGCEPGEI